ncbi:MAG TPA: DMT family transporter [Stellaceae bacterium]|nr:DMT family transporter [Stellaceae bacterium]
MTASPLPENRHAARRSTLLPYLLLTLCSLIWAGNWVVGRAVRDSLPPAALAFWRWCIAALVLAPIVLPRLKGKGHLLLRHWKVLALLGGTGISLFQFLIYTGLRYTSAVNAMLMNSAMPLFMVLVAWLIDGHKVTPRQVAGMVVSFCGILVIMNRGDWSTLRDFSFNPGDLVILAGMPVWGVYSVVLRRRPAELDALSLVFVLSVIGALFLAPAYALESLFLPPALLSWGAVGAVLYVALFASIAAYLCWNRGVDMIGPNRAGFTQHLIPAFGTALAVAFLGEEVHPFHAVGIATILLGVWLASSARGPA